MKKPPSQSTEPKTMLGMPPVLLREARNEEPKTTINTSSSLRVAMQMRARAAESREPDHSGEEQGQAQPAQPAQPAQRPDFAFTPTPTRLSRTRTSLGRRISLGLVIGSAGVVLIFLLVLRPDVDRAGAAPILHDAASGRDAPRDALAPAPVRSPAPSPLPAPRVDAPATPRRQPLAGGARADRTAPPAPREAIIHRNLEHAPPPPSSSRPAAAAARRAELAALEKQAVEMLVASQFEAAHATYAKLLAAAPAHREYAVMLELLASKLRAQDLATPR
jgi:hypothetical protein